MPDKPLFRDASDRLTFEMFRVPCCDYPSVCAAIVSAFSLLPHTPPILGPDQVFGNFHRNEQVVELAWDNWSGFVVTAQNPEAEPLVREIGAFLETSSWAEAVKPQNVPAKGVSS